MAILALDTATAALTLACGDESGRLLAEWTTVAARAHATHVHPLIDEMLAVLGLDARELTGILVGVGPGSYTGVRIGVTAAKSLAWALSVPVVGISSLAAMAHVRLVGPGLVAAVVDARRGEAYAGLYGEIDGSWSAVVPEQRSAYETIAPLYVRAAREAAARLGIHSGGAAGAGRDAALSLVGDGAAALAAQIARSAADEPGVPLTVTVLDETATARASEVYRLGWAQIVTLRTEVEENGYEQRAHALVPRYLQLAEAEARWRSGQGLERPDRS